MGNALSLLSHSSRSKVVAVHGLEQQQQQQHQSKENGNGHRLNRGNGRWTRNSRGIAPETTIASKSIAKSGNETELLAEEVEEIAEPLKEVNPNPAYPRNTTLVSCDSDLVIGTVKSNNADATQSSSSDEMIASVSAISVASQKGNDDERLDSITPSAKASENRKAFDSNISFPSQNSSMHLSSTLSLREERAELLERINFLEEQLQSAQLRALEADRRVLSIEKQLQDGSQKRIEQLETELERATSIKVPIPINIVAQNQANIAQESMIEKLTKDFQESNKEKDRMKLAFEKRLKKMRREFEKTKASMAAEILELSEDRRRLKAELNSRNMPADDMYRQLEMKNELIVSLSNQVSILDEELDRLKGSSYSHTSGDQVSPRIYGRPLAL